MADFDFVYETDEIVEVPEPRMDIWMVLRLVYTNPRTMFWIGISSVYNRIIRLFASV
jgi:hypothetical protein